jgi:aminobenzoyl-glutamate utilization protein B
MPASKKTALTWVDEHSDDLSAWNQTLWHYAEPAWREYRSAQWYVKRLREEGFEVEAGSGGMPTAFAATWANKPEHGPVIAGYAEYDAVPGNCQAAVTHQQTRDGLSPEAAGHTDPHSALGIGSLGGLLATKAAMAAHDIPGTLKFFGEPAEKVRGSKPIHAARGYYDGLDAMISFHPFYMLPLCNTVTWDTHCGAAYAMIYRFVCDTPQTWQQGTGDSPIPQSHAATRAPGANDALSLMYTTSRLVRDSILTHTGGWSISEAILNAGQATADNLPARRADIQYLIRVPDLASAQAVQAVLDRNAQVAADATHCRWQRHWVSKSRPGLANHAMADIAYQALEEVGPPVWDDDAKQVFRAIQQELGLEPMADPILGACTQLIDPRTAEAKLRETLPPNQKAFTSDDYTDMCWHAPTARIYIARPAPARPRATPTPTGR